LGLKNSSARLFEIDTTLIALVGATIGKTGFLKFQSSTNQNIAGLYPNNIDNLNPIYLFYICQTLYDEYNEPLFSVTTS
jgi:restriction endonuclease S subunit